MNRLNIIRHMLSVVGEGGVSNEDSTHPSVQTANGIIDTENLDLQGRGWWFNREHALTLVPDNRGEVVVPASTIGFKISSVAHKSPAEKKRYVKRGYRVYDTIAHTYDIGCSIVADTVTLLSIDDLPALAGNYLMRKCAYEMYIDDDGDQFKTNKLESAAARAWQSLYSAEMQYLAVNALDSPQARRLRAGVGGSSLNPNLIGGRAR
ncbi:hypothetical protein HW532_20875 [Kaustia mangrovi]|uniref:Tail tubular protein A n=1 Tax=Kaustia mangrovi TaxID=2593653 RepID=A0A7S8C7R0_9HYPH|nr:hypothetical protein [Kaustia mangrovi]QPC44934.1 hypothetical protein HW532_20875 [Kaustia mangrovi]